MGGLSIATASMNVLAICAKLSGYIFIYIQSSSGPEKPVETLDIEINELSEVLSALITPESHDGGEEEYWLMVKQSIDGCNVPLESLERILKDANKMRVSAGSLNELGSKAARSALDGEDVALHRQQIAGYRRRIQLSQQLIMM
jgi:hypothetical protein